MVRGFEFCKGQLGVGYGALKSGRNRLQKQLKTDGRSEPLAFMITLPEYLKLRVPIFYAGLNLFSEMYCSPDMCF